MCSAWAPRQAHSSCKMANCCLIQVAGALDTLPGRKVSLGVAVPGSQAGKFLTGQFPAAALLQFSLQAVAQIQQVVGIEAGIIEHFWGKRSFAPVSLLVAFIHG